MPATYVVFDILYLNGQSCLNLPLYRRKELIEGIIEKTSSMIISHSFPETGIKLFEEACRHELEGIMAKKGDSPYLIGKRSRDWVKIKSKHEVTCYIVGYTLKDSLWGPCIEALVLAEQNGSGLSYCGHVRSGFRNAELVAIHKRLSDCRSQNPCVANARRWKGVQWVRPELKCLVVYNERTPGGHLRAPV